MIELDFKRFERKLQLYYFFNKDADEPDTEYPEPRLFEENSNWWPPKLSAKITEFCRKIKNALLLTGRNKIKHNLTNRERHALRNLKCNKKIIFKKGDKSSGIVVMDRKDYETKIYEMLNDANVYTKTNLNDTEAVKHEAD